MPKSKPKSQVFITKVITCPPIFGVVSGYSVKQRLEGQQNFSLSEGRRFLKNYCASAHESLVAKLRTAVDSSVPNFF